MEIDLTDFCTSTKLAVGTLIFEKRENAPPAIVGVLPSAFLGTMTGKRLARPAANDDMTKGPQ